MAENPEDLIVTDAELRRQLPALVEELEIGGSSTGGVYYDKAGAAVPYVYVVSDTDPGTTRVVDGETVEVWWVQTNPPDPSAWNPAAPTFNLAGKSYTIPTDDGATYTVHGVATTAGTYYVRPPETVNINAIPKKGYTFAAGATTAWSRVYEEAPLPYDQAVASVGAQWYYRLDEADSAYKGLPKNRGSVTTVTPWNGNTGGFHLIYGQTPAAGVGDTAVIITPGARWWLKDDTVPTAFSIAAAVNVQGMTPGFMFTADWAGGKRSDFNSSGKRLSTGIHHVGWTWDGTTKRTYVDGAEVSSEAMSWPTSAALQVLNANSSAGGGPGSSTVTFAGLVIDRSKAFTAAQMKTLSDAVTR